MIFADQWAQIDLQADPIGIVLDLSADDIATVMELDLETIRYTATIEASKHLGSRPVLCLSGGIDSQAACLLWYSKISLIDIVVFEFEYGLNKDEVNDALKFADRYGLKVNLIKSNVLRFLEHELKAYSEAYNISSPQFAIHCKFLNILREQGYTGAVFGGNGLVIDQQNVYFSMTKAQLLDLDNFEDTKFAVIPNFLSFNKFLCIKLALSTPLLPETDNIKNQLAKRYQNKILTYNNLGLYVMPQAEKKTGFEQLKEYYNTIHKDPFYFEKKFRLPLYRMNPNPLTFTHMEPFAKNFLINYCSNLT